MIRHEWQVTGLSLVRLVFAKIINCTVTKPLKDQRLYWDHMEEFYGIEYIHVAYDQVWSPEIILHNNDDGLRDFLSRFNTVVLKTLV